MTTEARAWGTVRVALSPYGTLERVENRLSSGTPDVDYAMLGVSGKIELKVDLTTLKIEQVLFAERWTRRPANGLCHLIWRHKEGWAIFAPDGIRAIYTARYRAQEVARLWTDTKPFPTMAALALLAPAGLRWTSAGLPLANSCSCGGSGRPAGGTPTAPGTCRGG